jgi:hypothetical protein
MLRAACLSLFVGLLFGSVQAQEKYTIKIGKSRQGDVYLGGSDELEKHHTRIEDLEGKLLQEDKKETTRITSFRETVLEKPEGKDRATKLKRHYDKAQTKEDGEAKPLPYQGKTVLIEKKGEKYQFHIEGGEALTGKDAKLLDDEFNKKGSSREFEKLLLPKVPVAVGESWKIDPEPIIKDFSSKEEALIGDAAKSTATGKLVRAYKKDGKQFGVLHFKVDLALKEIKAKDQTLALQPGAHMVITMDVDTCIDGSRDVGEGTMLMEMDLKALVKDPGGTPRAKVNVTASGKVKMSQQPASKE